MVIPFSIPRGVVPKSGTDELRGIADQGAPRKPLYTASESRPSEQVEALNDRCRAGDWDHEDKDTRSGRAVGNLPASSVSALQLVLQ